MPPHAFDSENRATMTVNGYEGFVRKDSASGLSLHSREYDQAFLRSFGPEFMVSTKLVSCLILRQLLFAIAITTSPIMLAADI